MCAKFGCGPTVVSKGGGGGTDRHTDKGKPQLYIVGDIKLLNIQYSFSRIKNVCNSPGNLEFTISISPKLCNNCMWFQCWGTHTHIAKKAIRFISGSGHFQASMFQVFFINVRKEESQITSKSFF